ncbi:MAG: STAS domain-containing protein [Akkermansia sp.]|nr:STAS domain-containing protein [Akkermansia sp.]
MTTTNLTHHHFEDFLWIRCSGRGSFVNSPALKTIADKYLESNCGTIVIDLEICPGVDSTFMGTLAGLARKAMAVGSTLQVASPTQRTRAAMESLGLDMIIDLDPADAPWQAKLDEIRATLAQAHAPSNEGTVEDLSEVERTRHVLEAHNTLRSMNKKNDETFGYVCETLEEDLQRHESEENNK